MRLFYFENQNGERVKLNNETGIFLYNPSGLGMEFSHGYSESGTGFYLRIKDQVAQNETGFTLVFEPKWMLVGENDGSNIVGRAVVGLATVGGKIISKSEGPYERYRKLLDWIFASEELYLVYCPYGNNEYYRRIEIRSIEKTELDKYGSLQTPVSVLPLTPWYLPSPLHVNFGEEDDEAMRHTFYYTSELIYAVGARDYTANIAANGHLPSAVKFTFKGQVNNPSFILRGGNSRKIYGQCDVTGDFVSTDTLVLSTAEQDSYIKKIDANGVETDLLDSIDITKNPFFRVPNTEPCEVSISGDNISGDASMLLYVYYRGV